MLATGGTHQRQEENLAPRVTSARGCLRKQSEEGTLVRVLGWKGRTSMWLGSETDAPSCMYILRLYTLLYMLAQLHWPQVMARRAARSINVPSFSLVRQTRPVNHVGGLNLECMLKRRPRRYLDLSLRLSLGHSQSLQGRWQEHVAGGRQLSEHAPYPNKRCCNLARAFRRGCKGTAPLRKLTLMGRTCLGP